MPTPAQVADLTARTDAVVGASDRAIRSLWSRLPLTSPQTGTDALLEVMPPVVKAHADVAGILAADWHADTRPAGAPRYTATLAPPAPDEQLEAVVRWSVGPAWESGDWDAALRQLLAGSARLTRDGARSTTRINALGDPAAGGYVRVARGDACPFCLMLAARGAVYVDEDSASRTSRAGRAFHDHCRCTPSPVYTPDDIPDANKALADRWVEVTAGKTGAAARTAWAQSFQAT